MTNKAPANLCERCGGSGLVEGKVAWIDCSCQPQQEYHHPDYCKTCKADIGITGVCAVHGKDQPQQERSECLGCKIIEQGHFPFSGGSIDLEGCGIEPMKEEMPLNYCPVCGIRLSEDL